MTRIQEEKFGSVGRFWPIEMTCMLVSENWPTTFQVCPSPRSHPPQCH